MGTDITRYSCNSSALATSIYQSKTRCDRSLADFFFSSKFFLPVIGQRGFSTLWTHLLTHCIIGNICTCPRIYKAYNHPFIMCDCWQTHWTRVGKAWHHCHLKRSSSTRGFPATHSTWQAADISGHILGRNYHIPTRRREAETLPSRTWFIYPLAARRVQPMLLSRLVMNILLLLLARPLGLALFLLINRFHMLTPLCWWKFFSCRILLVWEERQKLKSEEKDSCDLHYWWDIVCTKLYKVLVTSLQEGDVLKQQEYQWHMKSIKFT